MQKKKATYLERYGYPDQQLFSTPNPTTEIIIVIPCYKEKEQLITLDSLLSCDAPNCHTEAIIVFNGSVKDSKEIQSINTQSLLDFNNWILKNTPSHLTFHAIECFDLPPKDAGVGLARKIGMDEAVRRFIILGKEQGVILCTDADTLFIKNYLIEIETYFTEHPTIEAVSIDYKHPLNGENGQQIAAYEYHLNYYVESLRYAGYPHAYQTIGSSMAVRSNAYQKRGGMNKRKAGEDFYFLHKFIPHGNFGEIKTTHTIPSPRISDRVPFGTGKKMADWKNEAEFYTYNFQTFEDLKSFIDQLDSLFHSDDLTIFPKTVQSFLTNQEINRVLERIRKDSRTLKDFKKNFYFWFDGLKVLKFVHFLRDHFYPDVKIELTEKIIDKSSTS
ncbi:MAG: glycosyltransferase family 2 protein [Cyclobacteriaceae bacterium]